MRTPIRLIAALLFFFFSLSVLVAQDNTIKIGGIFDLTGATGDVGAPYSLGVREYIDYANGKGGINGKKVDLTFTDYKYQIQLAKDFYVKLVASKVVAIIGWGTGDTLELTQSVAKDQIPFVSASYDEKLTDPAVNPYNFVIGVTYSDQVKVILNHIAKNIGKNAKVAIFHNASAFGESPLAAATDQAAKLGITIVEKVPMVKDLDMKAKLADLNAKGVQAVIIQNVAVPTMSILKAYGELGLKMQLYGLNWTMNEDVVKNFPKILNGFIYAAVNAFSYDDVPGIKEIAQFKQTDISKSMKYIQGWITAKVLLEAMKKVQGDITGPKLKGALETFVNFSTGGITDNITFTAKSHKGAKKLKLYMFNADSGKFVPITDYTSAE